MFLYVGGYTKHQDEGIGVYRFDPETGGISHVETVANIVNPSFLAVGSDGRNVYSVAESPAAGSVVAYARDAESGTLRELNRQSSQGNGPCHVNLDHSGRYVLAANYGSGSIAAYPIGSDGSLEPASSAIQHEGSSVNPERQAGPHAHMIAPSPDGRHVYATDLGADRVFGYTLDTASGELVAIPGAGAAAEPGAGPRHFAFSPDGATVYVINELDSTLTCYAREAKSGRLDARQTVSTLPEGFDGSSSCAQVVVSPDGRFVYGSNRGHDSIAVWAVGEDGGLGFLRHVPAGGKTPRNFNLDPSGGWLLIANQDSDSVVVMRRDAETGLPEEPGRVHDMPSPCCLVFAGE